MSNLASVASKVCRTTKAAVLGSLMLVLANACAPVSVSPTAAPTSVVATAPAKAEAPATPPPKTAAAAATAGDKPADGFYAGKTIRVITGFTPGGLFDGWSRLLAKHMPKYIPGNPSMIVENMPGAGSLTAANHVYKVAPKDGTVIGNFIQSMILNQINGLPGIEFDMRDYEWLGAVADTVAACVTRDETGVKTLEDTLPPSSKQVILGTSAPGSTGYDYPSVMSKALGANFKIVTGYPGNAEVRLAIEKQEVDGYCVAYEVLKPTLQPWIESGQPKFTIFVQAPPEGEKHPEMPNVPVLWDYVKNDDDKQVFKLLIAPEQFYWPFAAPPGTPPERVQTLRKAMSDAFNDPELNAEAEKANWTKKPVSGEAIQKIIREVLDTPEPIKARLKEYMAAR
jgi:tripartite-type tricarboxylate transporter receptor subunit TctC